MCSEIKSLSVNLFGVKASLSFTKSANWFSSSWPIGLSKDIGSMAIFLSSETFFGEKPADGPPRP
jgi:hypothetical protein